jgi:hypothetical protein
VPRTAKAQILGWEACRIGWHMCLEAAVPLGAAVPVEQVSCWPEQEASEVLGWEQAHRLVGTSPE